MVEFKINLEEYQQLMSTYTISEKDINVVYSTPNQKTWERATTIFTKECDTIDWISKFYPEDVMIDVGANVGMYSIWAAKTRGVQVFAFEPESQNYAVLNQNIVLNNLIDKVMAYCVALSDEVVFSRLYLSCFQAGGALHSFKENVDLNLKPTNFKLSQGCFSTTLDQLVSSNVIPIPQHIKIDVDGFEHKVISGAWNVINHPKLKSILVEINKNIEEHCQTVKQLVKLGFEFSQEQVDRSLHNDDMSEGVANYIFWR